MKQLTPDDLVEIIDNKIENYLDITKELLELEKRGYEFDKITNELVKTKEQKLKELKEYCYENLEVCNCDVNGTIQDILNGYNNDCKLKNGKSTTYKHIRFMFDL